MNTEAVHHPKHYNDHPSGVEAILICAGMNFCLGNAFKYLYRCGLKDAPLQDLKKALWYVEYEMRHGKVPLWRRLFQGSVEDAIDYCLWSKQLAIVQVITAEDRFEGRMKEALSYVYAASDKGCYASLDRARRVIEEMITHVRTVPVCEVMLRVERCTFCGWGQYVEEPLPTPPCPKCVACGHLS